MTHVSRMEAAAQHMTTPPGRQVRARLLALVKSTAAKGANESFDAIGDKFRVCPKQSGVRLLYDTVKAMFGHGVVEGGKLKLLQFCGGGW